MWQTNSLRLEHCLIFSSTCANYAIFSPVLVNFAKLGIDRSCAGLRILLQMKKNHRIKKYYLYFQLFLVHWRLRWAISAKIENTTIWKKWLASISAWNRLSWCISSSFSLTYFTWAGVINSILVWQHQSLLLNHPYFRLDCSKTSRY